MESLYGKIEMIDIEDEMKSSFMDYAMSVIVSRALPDVRDGLKPVHRRILFAMYDMGIRPGQPYKKCARIVGEVLGKYHPHGDAAVYDTMVRMAQDFSYRYEFVDGHGNFGSVDGDSPAAMRYTEARLSPIVMELLRDIEKDTVDFGPNFDESLEEPLVLPARYPNILVNGAAGIAVGMATNMPPHNLGEVIDATIAMINQPDIGIKELMKYIKAPDFPTGGAIIGREGTQSAYNTGRGVIKIRGTAHIEQMKNGKHRIVITELPFQVNKARLAEKIAELVGEKKIQDISDLRDESDRSGMRLVVEVKKGVTPQVVLNNLIKRTQLEVSFGINMLALVDGVPRVLSLAEILNHYIRYQKEIVTRRTKFDLAKAEERAHILEGLLIALKNIDEVISIIKSSKTVEEARKRLIDRFALSVKQAQAILDMRLHRLTGLEQEKIEREHSELVALIAELKAILADENKLMEIIKSELKEIRKKHADERRTKILEVEGEFNVEDLIEEEEVVITITHSGYIKSLPVTTYKKQKRGGRGVMGMDLKEDDFVEHLFITSTHDYILFFSNKGKVYRKKVHELPLGSRTAKGQAIVNLLPFAPGEEVSTVISTKEYRSDQFLLMATKNGLVKKTAFSEYDTSRKDGVIALTLRDDDELIKVKLTSGDEDIIIVSRKGQAIRFKAKNLRAIGRTSMGVKGIALEKDDSIIGMDVVRDDADLFIITTEGYGKRTPISEYPIQNRGGKGVKTVKLVKGKGYIAGERVVKQNHELVIISQEGIVIRLHAGGISSMGRNTQGVKIMNLAKTDTVSSVARMVIGEELIDEELIDED